MTDADRTELIEALVRLATGYEQALVLVDKALGVSGPQKRLTAGDLAGARGEAAACRAQLIAVRLRGATLLDGATAESRPTAVAAAGNAMRRTGTEP
jgi:hypothetical protein